MDGFVSRRMDPHSSWQASADEGEGPPFLHIKKKMGRVLDLKVGKQVASALTIIEVKTAPQPIKNKLPSY